MNSTHPSWATTHVADDDISRNATLHCPIRDSFHSNRVGELHQGVISGLTETRPTQHVGHFLPAVVHDIS
jgi:hypothetical protein